MFYRLDPLIKENAERRKYSQNTQFTATGAGGGVGGGRGPGDFLDNMKIKGQ